MAESAPIPTPEQMAQELQNLAVDLSGAAQAAQEAFKAGKQLDTTTELAENVWPIVGRLANVLGYQTVIAAQVAEAAARAALEELPDLVEDLVDDVLGEDNLTPETVSLLLGVLARFEAQTVNDDDIALIGRAKEAVIAAASDDDEESDEGESEEESDGE